MLHLFLFFPFSSDMSGSLRKYQGSSWSSASLSSAMPQCVWNHGDCTAQRMERDYSFRNCSFRPVGEAGAIQHRMQDCQQHHPQHQQSLAVKSAASTVQTWGLKMEAILWQETSSGFGYRTTHPAALCCSPKGTSECQPAIGTAPCKASAALHGGALSQQVKALRALSKAVPEK